MLFFELIQVAIGRRERLSIEPSASEWQYLYQLSLQHALLGVCCQGMRRLPAGQCPPEDIVVDWVWQTQRIRERNELLSQRSAEACLQLEADGFDACLLKGQGIARLYGALADYRQAGDIDIWVRPHDQAVRHARRHIIEYVWARHPATRLRYHHIEHPVFDDAEVELHFMPIYLNNPLHNHRLKRWFRSQVATQMSHRIAMGEEGQVSVPTLEFEQLYLLLHIYKHLFEEGLGLRQLMDYYFVLANAEGHGQMPQLIRQLRLETLAGAVMYIMREVFGLPDDRLVCPPRKAAGIALLSEIMQSGNFGLYDTRYDKVDFHPDFAAQLHRFWRKTKRNIALSYYFPQEGLWEPVFRIYHYFWRFYTLHIAHYPFLFPLSSLLFTLHQ